MVMSALPVVRAVEAAIPPKRKRRGTGDKSHSAKATRDRRPVVVWFSPAGKPFTNKEADKLAKYDDVVLVCGRYEGIDERAKKILKRVDIGCPRDIRCPRVAFKEYAVGEATYTGGEVPALAIVDAVTRRLPGVLGKDASIEERRVASRAVYTRPETIEFKKKKYRVPKVLQTGHHAKIDAWRKAK